MDKIRNLLSSASGKRVGPPVPPRPSPAAVQKALEKTRHQSSIFTNNEKQQLSSLNILRRTVIFKSTNISNGSANDQHRHSNVNNNENKHDDDSSTGLIVVEQNGNNVKANDDVSNAEKKTTMKDPPKMLDPIIVHQKLHTARPRAKTPTTPNLLASKHITVNGHQVPSIYTEMIKQNQSCSRENLNDELKSDDALKEKFFSEMLERANDRLVEASNSHVKYGGHIIKRSNSCDFLNERNIEIDGGSLRDRKPKERKVVFHELLISELSEMRKKEKQDQSTILSQFLSSNSSPDISPIGTQRINRTSIIMLNKEEPSKHNTCIGHEDSGLEDEEKMDDCSSSGVGDSWDSAKDVQDRIKMSLPGLPPLPKSLSGVELTQQQIQLHQLTQSNNYRNIIQQQALNSFDSQRSLTSSSSSSMSRRYSTLDSQLAILRREMYGLRQLDLSLLSQLWALNESIQEFRTIMQEQETLSPQSPSPSNSDMNSLVSDDEDINEDRNNNLLPNGSNPSGQLKDNEAKERDFIEDMHQKLEKQIQRMRIAPPAPPPRNPHNMPSPSQSRPI